MHLELARCTYEHKSQFEMYFTRSLQGQGMKHRSVLSNIWPIWPNVKNRFALNIVLITESTDQMLT